MRLIKSQKEAFVRAVIQDIPVIDFNQQCREIMEKSLKKIIPKHVQDFAAKNPGWIELGYYSTPSSFNNFAFIMPCSHHNEYRNSYIVRDKDAEAWQKLVELGNLEQEQKQKIKQVERQLQGVIYSCTTLKQALEQLPEFKKYLPSEEEPSKNLPVANIVSELNALGFPKKGKK